MAIALLLPLFTAAALAQNGESSLIRCLAWAR